MADSGRSNADADIPAQPRFDYRFIPGVVDESMPLIYRWEVRDSTGRLVGVYVGKAKGGSERPKTQYRRNVQNLLLAKPYRAGKPSAFRRIHSALAEATRLGHNIELHLVCNVAPSEDINAVEQAQIRAARARGTEPWQLNG